MSFEEYEEATAQFIVKSIIFQLEHKDSPSIDLTLKNSAYYAIACAITLLTKKSNNILIFAHRLSKAVADSLC